MFVRVTETEPAHLVEPEVLTSLSVVLVGDAPRDLGKFGSFDGDHAWLGVNAIRTAAHQAGLSETWDEQFEGMLAYAKDKGWLSSSGTALRAHVEQH
jgi:hypothetical protein